MHRREFLRATLATGAAATLGSCRSTTSASPAARLLVLAFDGIDPQIVRSLMDAGRMPNLASMVERGSFRKLATSTPPHTPVAFSSILTGTDPGAHQIFDFIHRDPNPPGTAVVRPYFSTAEAVSPESQWSVSVGRWRLPLSGGYTELRRRQPAFWQYLIREGIDTDVYFVPANYPVEPADGAGRFRSISGMGTPDLLGGYGSFTLFSTNELPAML